MGVDADRFREFERTAHDRLSQSYHEFFTPVTALALDGLLGSFDIKPGLRVLDVACGPGGVAAALRRRCACVTGIDLAPGMVALTSRLNPGIELREGNVEALPFPDKSFNAAVCNFGLGHFPRSEVASANAFACLRQVEQPLFLGGIFRNGSEFRGFFARRLPRSALLRRTTCHKAIRCSDFRITSNFNGYWKVAV
ncbi:MAG: class I SAM-dependent methyltransferase [Acetobacteraceae bacterium]|nr:class I SAM-dependent methyltransferase [Acetobacteraceae bacterium]